MNTLGTKTLTLSVCTAALLAVGGSGTVLGAADAVAAPAAAHHAKPRLIVYAGGESVGVTVKKRSDAKKLHGAPPAFKRFIGRTAQHIRDTTECSGAAVGVTVEAVRTDGYGVGGVNDCGGYQALWAVVKGSWKEIDGTQDEWECRTLHRYTVPSDIAGNRCVNYKTGKEHRYHQA